MHICTGRFLVHDREDEKMELFVTKNFGETFSHAGDYIKSFYFDHREVPSFCSKSVITLSLFRMPPCFMCHEWSQVATWTSSAPPPSSRGRSTPEWSSPEPNNSRRRMVSSLLSQRWRKEVLTGSSMWPDLAKGFFSLPRQQHITFIFRQIRGCRVPRRSEPLGLPCGWSDLRWWLAGHSQPCRQFVFALHQWCSIRVWGGKNVFLY